MKYIKDNDNQPNLLEPIENLYKEWHLWSKCFGKVLLVSGPPSSGKTTLVFKMIEKFPVCQTINRKKIHYDSCFKIGEIFFGNIFKEIKEIIGKEITHFFQLNAIKLEDIEDSKSDDFVKIKEKMKKIFKSDEYNEYALMTIFTAYYEESKKYIFAGYNLILDEVLLNTEKSYEIFCYCFNYYPMVKRMLLFNTVEELLKKCIARNNDFLAFSSQYTDLKSLYSASEKLEMETGNSSLAYRFPTEIMRYYKEFYDFKLKLNTYDIVLEQTSQDRLKFVINEMNEAQLYLITELKRFKSSWPIEYLNTNKEIYKIFEDSVNQQVYITTKLNYDYVLRSSKIENLKLLDDKNFLIKFLGKVLLWLTGESINLEKPQHYCDKNVEHIVHYAIEEVPSLGVINDGDITN